MNAIAKSMRKFLSLHFISLGNVNQIDALVQRINKLEKRINEIDVTEIDDPSAFSRPGKVR